MSCLDVQRKIVLRRLIALLFALVANAHAVSAQGNERSTSTNDDDAINADRPGIADGSRVIGRGWLQLETGLQRENRRDADVRTVTTFIPTLLRAGITDQLEIRIEGNTASWSRTTQDVGPATTSSGFAPTSLGLKYQILDSKGERRHSVGTIVRLFPPSGTGDFGSHRYTSDIRLADDWDFASKLSLNSNVGLARLEGDAGEAFNAGLGAITLTILPTPTLNAFVDMGLQSRESVDGPAAVTLDAGITYIIGHNVQLDASAGRGAHGTTPPHPFIAVGLSVRTKR
jgi:hypothetical protein